MEKTVYQVGDTVYHYKYGNGTVIEIQKDCVFPVKVKFQNGAAFFNHDGKEDLWNNLLVLSFTPYNFVTGGFSQERPLPNIKKGDPIFVKNKNGIWKVRVFCNFTREGNVVYFEDGYCSDDVKLALEWKVKNPFNYN